MGERCPNNMGQHLDRWVLRVRSKRFLHRGIILSLVSLGWRLEVKIAGVEITGTLLHLHGFSRPMRNWSQHLCSSVMAGLLFFSDRCGPRLWCLLHKLVGRVSNATCLFWYIVNLHCRVPIFGTALGDIDQCWAAGDCRRSNRSCR